MSGSEDVRSMASQPSQLSGPQTDSIWQASRYQEGCKVFRLSSTKSSYFLHQVSPGQGRRTRGQDRQQWVSGTAGSRGPRGMEGSTGEARVRMLGGCRSLGVRIQTPVSAGALPRIGSLSIWLVMFMESELLNCQRRHVEKVGT